MFQIEIASINHHLRNILQFDWQIPLYSYYKTHVIGKAVWDQGGDIRDVISIGKLVRKNDGPEEVEQILRTMIKYGEMKEH